MNSIGIISKFGRYGGGTFVHQKKNITKDVNKTVKRNIDRFPEDFYFKLTEN